MYPSNPIPVIGFAGFSGSGKTTLIEQLIEELHDAHGMRVGVIKHDGHEFEIDHKGKDSARFTAAGADVTIITSDTKTAIIEQRRLSLEAALLRVTDVDLILVEGYKYDPTMPQIGICRAANGEGLPADASRYVALVTDTDIAAPIPSFAFDEIDLIAEFILEFLELE